MFFFTVSGQLEGGCRRHYVIRSGTDCLKLRHHQDFCLVAVFACMVMGKVGPEVHTLGNVGIFLSFSSIPAQCFPIVCYNFRHYWYLLPKGLRV